MNTSFEGGRISWGKNHTLVCCLESSVKQLGELGLLLITFLMYTWYMGRNIMGTIGLFLV